MKKNRQEKRVAMQMAGVLTTNWGMVEKAVLKRGGRHEDLHILGEPENEKTIAMVDGVAEKLVELGKASRETSVRVQPSPIPPQRMFSPVLMPKHLFIIQKNGADAPTLLSAMEGKCFVSSYAKGMMEQVEHFIIGPPETALLGVFSYDQLGVTDWPETEFFGPKGWEYIQKFGLKKCLPDDGQYARIAHPNQELREWFRVGHNPIPFGGYSAVWVLGRDERLGRFLRGWYLHSGYRLRADHLVALRLAN